MKKSRVISLIKSRLGDRSDPGIDAKINEELDMAQYELENHGDFTPWFLLSETARFITIIGESRVPLPSDMLHEYEEGALYCNGSALVKREYEYLRRKYRDSTGIPREYALVDGYFILFPTPDDEYELDMKYYRSDVLSSSLPDDGENKWLRHAADWLLAKAGSAVARFIRDNEAAALFIADEQRAAARVYKAHTRWIEENADRVMGSE